MIYRTSTDCWMRNMIEELSEESPALISVCAALELTHPAYPPEQHYLFVENALRVFRSRNFRRGTLCACLLMYNICNTQSLRYKLPALDINSS